MSDESAQCPNCTVDMSQFDDGTAVGHRFDERDTGIDYHVDHLADLGHVEANGISLLFNQWGGVLEIRRKRLSLQEIAHEIEWHLQNEEADG